MIRNRLRLFRALYSLEHVDGITQLTDREEEEEEDGTHCPRACLISLGSSWMGRFWNFCNEYRNRDRFQRMELVEVAVEYAVTFV